MRHSSSDRLNWKKNKLYYEKELKIEIIEDFKYSNMFRLKWPDGVLSEDFYNITWAKYHACKIAMVCSDSDTEEKPSNATQAALSTSTGR